MTHAKRHHKRVPPISEQTPFKTGFFRFGPFEQGKRLFNPSLYSNAEGDWLIARVSETQEYNPFGKNTIWSFLLDANHNPVRGVKVDFGHGYKNQHWEDPRVTTLRDGRAFLSHTTFCLEIIWNGDSVGNRWWGAHQQAALLDENFQPAHIIDPIFGWNGGSVLTNNPKPDGSPSNEKNWLWFEHDGALRMVYMTQPHQVVSWSGDFSVSAVDETDGPIEKWWPYGQPRGGTPPVRVGDEYWSFFHSSTPWVEWEDGKKRRYHMAAYAFEAKPPFRITRFAKVPILTGSPKDPWGPGQPLVVFPCGALLKNGTWLVSMGVNDMASAWIEIPHVELEKLTPLYGKANAIKESKADSATAEVPACCAGDRSDDSGVAKESGSSVLDGERALDGTRSDCASNHAGQLASEVRPARRRIRRRHSPSLRNGNGIPAGAGLPATVGGTA